MREQRPPVKEFFSRTVTRRPALARRAARATPPAPAPSLCSASSLCEIEAHGYLPIIITDLDFSLIVNIEKVVVLLTNTDTTGAVVCTIQAL